MALYLFIAPVCTLFLISAWFGYQDHSALARQGLKGGAFYFLVLIVELILNRVWHLSFTPLGIWGYYVVLDYVMPVGLASVAFYLTHRSRRDQAERAVASLFAAFLAGFFTVAAITDIIRNALYSNQYELFLLPTNRIILTALIPLFVAAWQRESRALRFIYPFLMLLLPAGLAVVPMLFVESYRVLSYVACAGALGLAAALFIGLQNAYLPRRHLRTSTFVNEAGINFSSNGNGAEENPTEAEEKSEANETPG